MCIMHERLNILMPLLKTGEFQKASEALEQYCMEFPEDWDGKLFEGVIAQLQGDDKTFRSIHNDIQSIIDNNSKDAIQIKSSPLWEKYYASQKKNTKMMNIVNGIVNIIIRMTIFGIFLIVLISLLNNTLWFFTINRVIWTYEFLIHGKEPTIYF